MAIDFPNSPTVDDIFTVAEKSWIWDGSAWKVYFNPPVMYVQDTPPSVPKTGDQWYESDTGQHFVYYDSIWVETGSAITTNVNANDLSGTTLASNVTGSSLTSTGTLTSLAVTGDVTVDTSTFKVDATNNRVGIGTASPGATLDVQSASITPTIHATNSSVGNALTVTGNASVSNTLSVTQGLYVDTNLIATDSTNNRVGINTASPTHSLHVVGDARVTSDLTVAGGLQIDTNTLFVDATNNRVGVGTTGPGATLDVLASTGTAMRVTNTGIGASLLVEDSTSTDSTPFIIDAAGRVGIGTTSPASTLEVVGNAFIYGTGSTIQTRQSSGNDGVIVSGRAGGASNNNVTLIPTTLSTNRTHTLPDVTGESAVFVSGRGTNTTWTTYTSTITQLGNVTFSAYVSRYCQIGKLIHWEFAFLCTSAGSLNNAIRVNLPQTAQGNAIYSNYGTMHVYDASTNTHYTGHAFAYNFQQAAMMLNGGNTYFQTIALSSSDIVSGHIIYEAA
jgi:hypothetical protein